MPEVTTNILLFILYLVIALIGGAVAGFFISRYFFKRELQKNPPVTEKMIRVMLTQMGRKPSEKQVREIMHSMNNTNK